MRTSDTLPPLPSLRAFEAVARLSSFRLAGEELLISQSAISHHIRILESYLGTKLFTRASRGVSLTQPGSAYLKSIEGAFAAIAEATARLKGGSPASVINVSLLPSFAANWLVGRLPRFQALHPEHSVRLMPSLELADLANEAVDLAIRYGAGRWKGATSRMLMPERLTPVASPTLIRSGDTSNPSSRLLDHTLLRTRRDADWINWAKRARLDLTSARFLDVTDYNVAVEAALNGHGIAMGRMRLVERYLQSGRLVRPSNVSWTSERFGYWILMPRRAPKAGALAFRDWMLTEATS